MTLFFLPAAAGNFEPPAKQNFPPPHRDFCPFFLLPSSRLATASNGNLHFPFFLCCLFVVKMKYVLVSGGVISGIGKGLIASSTGLLLKTIGLKICLPTHSNARRLLTFVASDGYQDRSVPQCRRRDHGAD